MLSWTLQFIERAVCCFSSFPPLVMPPCTPLPPAAPSQAISKIMWNTSNSKVILRWDQVHALENESEVTGYKVNCEKEKNNNQLLPGGRKKGNKNIVESMFGEVKF